MIPFNKLNKKFFILKCGFSLCSLYKYGIKICIIIPSSGLNDISSIPLAAKGIEVNNKLNKLINQSSIIV